MKKNWWLRNNRWRCEFSYRIYIRCFFKSKIWCERLTQSSLTIFHELNISNYITAHFIIFQIATRKLSPLLKNENSNRNIIADQISKKKQCCTQMSKQRIHLNSTKKLVNAFIYVNIVCRTQCSRFICYVNKWSKMSIFQRTRAFDVPF